MTIYPRHLKLVTAFSSRPGICNSRARVWAKSVGIDWSTFVRSGIDSSVLLATGNPMARKVVEAAELEAVSRG